jgi:hypothetical protein
MTWATLVVISPIVSALAGWFSARKRRAIGAGLSLIAIAGPPVTVYLVIAQVLGPWVVDRHLVTITVTFFILWLLFFAVGWGIQAYPSWSTLKKRGYGALVAVSIIGAVALGALSALV